AHQEHRVAGVERSDRARINLAAAIDEDVLVLARQQPEELLDGPAVGGAGPIELIGAGQDLQAGLVLHDELLEELAIEPVEIVDGVEQAVTGPHAEEER